MNEPRRRRRSGDEPPGGLPLLPLIVLVILGGPALRRRARSLLRPIQLAGRLGCRQRNADGGAFTDSTTSIGAALADAELDASIADCKHEAFAVDGTFIDADADADAETKTFAVSDDRADRKSNGTDAGTNACRDGDAGCHACAAPPRTRPPQAALPRHLRARPRR